jgi:hypothetical protein
MDNYRKYKAKRAKEQLITAIIFSSIILTIILLYYLIDHFIIKT